jgi:glucose-6-phosphate isomerase
MTLDPTILATDFDILRGTLATVAPTRRHLADLRGCFADVGAFERALTQGNPLVYTVAAVERSTGAGDLHYGLGTVYPGCVGDEYFLTKGHLHSWRAAAEVYIGLAGDGAMLLEEEGSDETVMVPLTANTIVYVPGHTAHRTVNTGEAPLVYLGVYPARAGHDYAPVAQRNFRSVLLKQDGRPCLLRREAR